MISNPPIGLILDGSSEISATLKEAISIILPVKAFIMSREVTNGFFSPPEKSFMLSYYHVLPSNISTMKTLPENHNLFSHIPFPSHPEFSRRLLLLPAALYTVLEWCEMNFCNPQCIEINVIFYIVFIHYIYVYIICLYLSWFGR